MNKKIATVEILLPNESYFLPGQIMYMYLDDEGYSYLIDEGEGGDEPCIHTIDDLYQDGIKFKIHFM